MEVNWIQIAGYAVYLLAAYVGMFAHFLKKNIKGETSTQIADYFRNNFRSTLLAVISTCFGFALLVITDSLNLISAFTIGYTFDSALNKWDDNSGQEAKAKITGD